MARRCVVKRNLENEEAKTLYGAVENTTKRVVMPKKTNNNNKLCVHIWTRKLVNMSEISVVTMLFYPKKCRDNT